MKLAAKQSRWSLGGGVLKSEACIQLGQAATKIIVHRDLGGINSQRSWL